MRSSAITSKTWSFQAAFIKAHTTSYGDVIYVHTHFSAVFANGRSDTAADPSNISVKELSNDFWSIRGKGISLNSAPHHGLQVYGPRQIPLPPALPFRFHSDSHSLTARTQPFPRNTTEVTGDSAKQAAGNPRGSPFRAQQHPGRFAETQRGERIHPCKKTHVKALSSHGRKPNPREPPGGGTLSSWHQQRTPAASQEDPSGVNPPEELRGCRRGKLVVEARMGAVMEQRGSAFCWAGHPWALRCAALHAEVTPGSAHALPAPPARPHAGRTDSAAPHLRVPTAALRKGGLRAHRAPPGSGPEPGQRGRQRGGSARGPERPSAPQTPRGGAAVPGGPYRRGPSSAPRRAVTAPRVADVPRRGGAGRSGSCGEKRPRSAEGTRRPRTDPAAQARPAPHRARGPAGAVRCGAGGPLRPDSPGPPSPTAFHPPAPPPTGPGCAVAALPGAEMEALWEGPPPRTAPPLQRRAHPGPYGPSCPAPPPRVLPSLPRPAPRSQVAGRRRDEAGPPPPRGSRGSLAPTPPIPAGPPRTGSASPAPTCAAQPALKWGPSALPRPHWLSAGHAPAPLVRAASISAEGAGPGGD